VSSPELYFRPFSSQPSVGKAAVRGGGWALLAQAVDSALRVVGSMTLARLLMPADFGLYAMVVSLTSGLLIFMDLGLPDAIIQSPTLTDRQASTLFWVNLGISVTVAGSLVAASPALRWFYREPRLVGLVAVWSFTIIFGALKAQHIALLKRAMLFRSVSKLSMIAAMISNAVAIALAWQGAGYWALVLREVMNQVVGAAGSWFLCRWRPGMPCRRSGIRSLLVFGGQAVASFIARRTTRNLDRTLLGWRFGPVVTGWYHTAFELSAMATSLMAEPLRNVAVSSLSRLREEPGRFREHFLKAIRLVAVPCFGATVVLVATGTELVEVFLGPRWQRSGEILRIVGLSSGVSAVYATSIWLHCSLGRADRMARWTILEGGVIVAGVSAGLRFGADGVAWGYTVSMWVLCVAGLWYAGRPVGLSLRVTLAALWTPAVAALAAGCFCWYVVLATGLAQGRVARAVFFCTSFGAVYLWLIVMMGGGIGTVKSSLGFLKKCRSAEP